MDTAMRDLEQIEERDPEDGQGRSAAVFLLATLVTGGLVYGVAQLLGGGEAVASDHDPLAALAEASELSEAAREAEAAEAEPVEVDRTELAFPEALGGDERPEVEASFAAAAAEHERLQNGAVFAGARPPSPTSMALPAAALATPQAEELAETATRDSMVAAALPAAERSGPRGTIGMDGKYTLQVASYRDEAEADAFAIALRDRGHDAFTMRADIEGRGIFHRVRIGPFDTGREAEAYRREFERNERMDTYVVRRRD